jgi:hypothetical protein
MAEKESLMSSKSSEEDMLAMCKEWAAVCQDISR